MNIKQTKARASKMLSKNIDLRKECWPDIDSKPLWNRKEKNGYTTMPRPMPQIFQIMDHLANKGKPVSLTYLSLWCRVFDESMIEIKSEKVMASEAGFTGERAVTTWHSRMKNLIEMGFIEAKPGQASKYQYVLILNPYVVINNLKKGGKVPETLSLALFSRAQEVGADDDLK
jgi:hypothetical protein